MIALNLAIVLLVAGGTAAYGAFSKTITVTIDGQKDTIRTFGDTVSDVLAAKDITINDGDKLSPSPATAVDDGDSIDISYAKPVTLAVDGTVTKHTVFDRTVGEALDEFGVKPAADAYVSDKRSAPLSRKGSEIVISTEKTLTVVADGKSKKVTTEAPTVAKVLEAANVALDKDDEVKPGKAAFVKPDQKLKVVRIEKVTKTEVVRVKFPVEVRKDSEAMVGEVSVVKAGKKGKSREKVTLVMADGKLRDRIVLTSEVLVKPVGQVESHGTSTTPPDSVWDKIAQCESGGNWHINTGNGYYGGLQFSAATWRSVGGPGLPHQNSREVQIKYAKILQARSGWGQWGCAHARFD
ncbi:uncharacterized protein YabE (DUF348 family) [Aeromicrobium panaciterrae]|uniref:Uncharacterized protein YabE (DUF348 family) n=1 Tax=Aeromicrobium panaciterrae TaxID=363861 RepID=A0ABU1ULM6_9ACTN|nr:ubiquitin-like domain-containing protein [Aeromicrobium panaciterrae]MDR7086087.1 uncharacterized protein YabE (DUF348 family) [Aeromicrobium panaciterrae]